MESRSRSLKTNAAFNLIRTASTILFPLITFPYISRVLGVNNLGKINYGLSIVNYFLLLAILGIPEYAIREGARVRQDKSKIEQLINELFSISMITTTCSYLILITLLIAVPQLRDYRVLILVQSISIVFTTLRIDWVNTIYEDFKYIAIRSIVVQAISIVFMIVFVKQSADYIIYAIIQSSTAIANCCINIIYCRRYIHLKLTKIKDYKKHFRSILVFFANNLAVQIYVGADTTMLGWMVGDYYTGLYAAGVKIYAFTKQLFVSMYAVSIPRLSLLFQQNKKSEFKHLITSIASVLVVFLVPASIGMILTAKDLIILFCGSNYEYGYGSLQLLAISLFFALLGGIITSCLNITTGHEKDNLLATVLASVINILLNILMIPAFYDRGAACTTIVAECVVLLVCLIRRRGDIREYIDILTIIGQLLHAMIGSVGIILISIICNSIIDNTLTRLILIILGSIFWYLAFMICTRNRFILRIVNEFKNTILKYS